MFGPRLGLLLKYLCQLFSEEFCDLIGHEIPLDKLGFKTLQDLLVDAQDFCRVVVGLDGVVVVRALVAADTKHLAEVPQLMSFTGQQRF